LAAASDETGNNWAEQICTATVTSSPPTSPWILLSLIKLKRTLTDHTLKYYVAYY
jgi:hypothetical protein